MEAAGWWIPGRTDSRHRPKPGHHRAPGIDRTIPADTLHTVLRGLGESTARAHFGVDLDGVELRTDDIDWSLGSGTPVVGAAQDLALALVLSGRRLPTGLLHGQGSERFSA